MLSARFWYRTAPAGTILAFAAVILAMLALLPGHILVDLAIASVFAALVYFWLSQIDSTLEMRRPQDWQLDIPVDRRGVSNRSLNRVRHYFNQGEKVLRVTHQHIIVLLARMSLVVFLCLVCVGLSVLFGTVHINLPRHIPLTSTQSTATIPNHRLPVVKPALPGFSPPGKSPLKLHWPNGLTIPWWTPLILAAVFLLWGAYIWLKWTSWFFILTSERLVVLELPYPIFPFAEEDDNPFPISMIKRAEVKGSSVSKRWGLGTMNISTYLQPNEDDVIKNLFGLPQPDELMSLINQLTKDNSGELDQALGPQLKQLTAAVRENTEVQRRLHGQDDDAPTQEGW